jgi:hypothetical protein
MRKLAIGEMVEKHSSRVVRESFGVDPHAMRRAGTLSAVVRAQPKPPSSLATTLPADVEKGILRCFARSMSDAFSISVM